MDGLPTKNNAMLYPVGLRSYDEYPGPDDKFWENRLARGCAKRICRPRSRITSI